MVNTPKKIQALKQAAINKRNKTLLKVQTTLRIMHEKDLPINFEAVAKLAGVSKPWLYSQSEISQQINNSRIREGKIQRVIDLKSVVGTKDKEINLLKEKNNKLKLKIKQLRHQLENVYGELYQRNKTS